VFLSAALRLPTAARSSIDRSRILLVEGALGENCPYQAQRWAPKATQRRVFLKVSWVTGIAEYVLWYCRSTRVIMARRLESEQIRQISTFLACYEWCWTENEQMSDAASRITQMQRTTSYIQYFAVYVRLVGSLSCLVPCGIIASSQAGQSFRGLQRK